MRWISILFVLSMFSCKKDKPDPVVTTDHLDKCMLVLCEGLYQQNNSEVSFVNISDGSISNDFFFQRTSRSLGDTGNDMIRYGGKIYVVVNASSTIEVMDASNFNPIDQIIMNENNQAKQPRFVIGYGSNVYVSCYDGFVDVIDTTTLIVTQRIQVGANPEGLAVSNGKLYVANSGGLNYPNLDSTISVINLSSNLEMFKLTVGMNPGDVEVDDVGNIFVVCRGDYMSNPSSLVQIDAATDLVANTFAIPVTEIAPFQNGKILLAYNDFSGSSNQVGVFNVSIGALENPQFLDLSNVTSVYDIQYSMTGDKIYLCDAMNFTTTGYVHVFNSNGDALNSYHVGLNPTKILIYE